METYLLHLTDREIHNLLLKRGIRGADAQAVREQVKEHKRELKRKAARKRVIQDLWRGVLAPIANEQRTVRAMLRYESAKYPNPERREALNAYVDVLKKVKVKLREYKYYGIRTPKEQAEYEKEKGKTIPNNGEHWTDWVPDPIKNAIGQAFMDIPRSHKARVKDPFPRTITKTANAKLRATHIKTARQEILYAEQELGMLRELHKGAASEAERDAQATVDHLQNILNWLILADDAEPIPVSWGQLLVADLPTTEMLIVEEDDEGDSQ